LCSIYFHDRPAPFVKEIDQIIANEVKSLVDEMNRLSGSGGSVHRQDER